MTYTFDKIVSVYITNGASCFSSNYQIVDNLLVITTVVMSKLEQCIIDSGRFGLQSTFSGHNYQDIGL